MAGKEFVVEITLTDRIRRSHVTERGKVIRFVAQYEALIDQKWVAIVRYDTAHGFAHRDVMRPRQRSAEKTRLHLQDFGEAYAFAVHDLGMNWRRYREQYEQEVKRR
jgi:hypothetical protein